MLMAARRCLLAVFLVLHSAWPCAEGRLLKGKQAIVAPSSRALTLANYPPTPCNHRLSGVDDASVANALAHKGDAVVNASATSTQLKALQTQKIFVAACLHQSEDVMQHWTSELVRLLLALRANGKHVSLFVSIYESGSTDHTEEYLKLLEGHLNFLKIPCKIVSGRDGLVRDRNRPRIEYLADVRNRAMEPLRASTEVYDRVLWLSDNVFCADGVLQMLAHALPVPQGGIGADAVCGMDYVKGAKDECVFYDTWASHDISGHSFGNSFPIVNVGENELEAGEVFQVFSCWNGMVAFDASIFQKERLLFRFHRDDLGECAVAETELIFRDMWNIGRGKIAVSPKAGSSYNEAEFKSCALDSQPTEFDSDSAISWAAAPKKVTCCPLARGEDKVDFHQCEMEDWNRFNSSVPRLHSNTSAYLSQGEWSGDPNDDDWRGGDDEEGDSAALEESFLQIQDSIEKHSSKSTSFGKGGLDSTQNIAHAWHWSGASALVALVVGAYLSLSVAGKETVEGKQVYAAILFWMTMSFFMNLLNKQCTVILRCPFTLVLIQMCVSIIMLARTSFQLSAVRKEDLWRWCALSVLFGMMLCSSMFAFTHSSVTCLLVLRNCLPLFTLPLEKAMFPESVATSAHMVAPLFAIAIGAALYARFSPGYATTSTGLVWIVINCIVTVIHRVLERYVLTSDMKMSFEAMTLINNMIPLLPVGMLAWATGEVDQWPHYTYLLHSPLPIAVLACSGIVGLCLGQSSIMVQKCVTATTMMVLQTTNKFFIILAAMFFFHDRFTPMSFIGCGLSLLGCAAYGMAQHSAKQAAKELQSLLPDWRKAAKK